MISNAGNRSYTPLWRRASELLPWQDVKKGGGLNRSALAEMNLWWVKEQTTPSLFSHAQQRRFTPNDYAAMIA